MVFAWLKRVWREAQAAAAEQLESVAIGAPKHSRRDDAAFWRRQSLEAVVIKACGKCQAPGRYTSELRILEGWPGCFVKMGDPREGMPVGKVCPNCKAKRPKDAKLGEIWKKEYR